MASLKSWGTYFAGVWAITAVAILILITLQILVGVSTLFLLFAIIVTLVASNMWARRNGVSIWSKR